MLKDKHNWDFTDFMLDPPFVEQVNDPERSSGYIKRLKEEYPENTAQIDLAVEVLQGIRNKTENFSDRQREKVWSRIVSGRGRVRRMFFWRAAAAVLLIVALGVTALLLTQRSEIEKFAGTFLPDSLQPGLILADGRQVPVDGESSSVAYSGDGASVGINDTAQLRQEIGAEAFNQIIVPYGVNINLTLSDGTKVWLHSGSRLVYAPVFRGKNREVYLHGEAYFEVAHNPEKPFIVKTDRFSSRVYGTRFDVQAFEKEGIYSAMLLDGKVGLSEGGVFSREVILKPHQQGSYSGEKGGCEVQEVAYPENYISWIYGHLTFNNEKLDQLLGRVARYYNIEIEMRGVLPSTVITGKLDLKKDPERVLKGIAVLAKLRLAKQEEKYIFIN